MKKSPNFPWTRLWIAIAGSITLAIGGAYAMVQQSTRLSADDLPLSTAETARQELQTDSAAKDVVPSIKTDLRASTSVFVIVTDDTQHVLASSANLDGQTPLPPRGVFSFTQQHGTDHFTWEPSPGVRLAARVVRYKSGANGGYIIAGQSLKPYEERISTYTWIAAAAWLASLAWAYLLLVLPAWRAK